MSLNSISEISKVFSTSGSNPVLILANDLNDYICKYTRGVPASRLFNEYVASCFLQLWNLKTPAHTIINIAPEHIPNSLYSNTIQPRFFNTPCFGSLYLNEAKEIDDGIIGFLDRKKNFQTIKNPLDYFKIGLFDIWLANEDRHQTNYNMLLNPQPEGNYFYAIDHEKCFNCDTLERGLYQISKEESILTSPISHLIISKSANKNEIVENTINEYYLCVQECRKHLSLILQQIPSEWGIDTLEKFNLLEKAVFSDTWLRQTESSFKHFLSEH